MKERFICDSMVGRLAKWLRLFGFDTLYFSEISDAELVRRARDDNRVLLTRDTLLMERRPIKRGEVRAQLIESDDWRRQLRQVVSRFRLRAGEPRCPICNELPADVSRADAKESVPEYVWKTQPRFHSCPVCGRIFWKATHWDRILEIERDIMNEKE
jgi:uncharacterized protein with PIN domain